MQATTAERLRQIMNEERLRQVDILRLCEPVCARFGLPLSKSDLSQFVNGKVTPGQWKISILAKALNVSEAWLMGYDVPRERPPEYTAAEVQQIVRQSDEEEQQLLSYFRSLNRLGKTTLMKNAASYAQDPDYQAEPPAAFVS